MMKIDDQYTEMSHVRVGFLGHLLFTRSLLVPPDHLYSHKPLRFGGCFFIQDVNKMNKMNSKISKNSEKIYTVEYKFVTSEQGQQNQN